MRPDVARTRGAHRDMKSLDRVLDRPVKENSPRDKGERRGTAGNCGMIERVDGVLSAMGLRHRHDRRLDTGSLDLDVHRRAVADGREYVAQQWHARAAAQIHSGQLGPGGRSQRQTRDSWIVVHHHLAVCRQVHIQLQPIGTVLQGRDEAGQCVLAMLARGPTVSDVLHARAVEHSRVLFRNPLPGKLLTSGSLERLTIRMIAPEQPHDDPEDRELIARWKRGDQRAAGMLVARHAPSLARFAVSFGVRDDVEELVQDTLVRAFASIDGFRGDSSFRTWLFTIERRLLLDRRRAEARRRRSVEVQEDSAATEFDALDELVADESAVRVRRALDRLTPTQREVFLLRVNEGLSYRDIATACGTTEGAARVHYHHAMRTIKELLDA
jgi:RNA polymerase sigma-70 factor, ECF subfamily